MGYRAITTVSYITALNSEDAASCGGEPPGDTGAGFFGGKLSFPCCRAGDFSWCRDAHATRRGKKRHRMGKKKKAALRNGSAGGAGEGFGIPAAPPSPGLPAMWPRPFPAASACVSDFHTSIYEAQGPSQGPA